MDEIHYLLNLIFRGLFDLGLQCFNQYKEKPNEIIKYGERVSKTKKLTILNC